MTVFLLCGVSTFTAVGGFESWLRFQFLSKFHQHFISTPVFHCEFPGTSEILETPGDPWRPLEIPLGTSDLRSEWLILI